MTVKEILMNSRSLLRPLSSVLGKSLLAGFVVLALSLPKRLDAGGIMGKTVPANKIKVNLIRLGQNALVKITLGAGLLYLSGL